MIRYDPRLNAEIQRTVKNFNSKRSRIMNKSGVIIPEKLSIRSIKSEFTDRKTLLKQLKHWQDFSTRGIEFLEESDSGYRLNRWQTIQVNQMRERALRNLDEQIAEFNNVIEDNFLQPLQDANLNNLLTKRAFVATPVNEVMTEELTDYLKNINTSLDIGKINAKFYDNFFDAFFKLSGFSDLDYNRVQYVQDQLRQLTPRQLSLAFKNEGILRNILNIYNMIMEDFAGANYSEMEFEALEEALPGILRRYQ